MSTATIESSIAVFPTAQVETTVVSSSVVITPTRDPTSSQSSQEQKLIQELQTISFNLFDWPATDFRTRSVDLREFRGGGPPRDGIPPLFAPKFESVPEADTWLDEREPVQVVDINGDVRAYPQQILIWHELVNDLVGGEPILVTY